MSEQHTEPDAEAPKSKPSLIGRIATWGTGTTIALLTAAAIPFFIVPWLPRKKYGALPYMPTSERRIAAMFTALPRANTAPGRAFVDLGSGDGVAVLAAARRGMTAVGVELNPTLVAWSWLRAVAQGVTPWQAAFKARRLGLHKERAVDPEAKDTGPVVSGEDVDTSARESTGQAHLPSTEPGPQRPGSARFILGNIFDHDISPYDVIMAFGVVPLMPRIALKLTTQAKSTASFCSHKFPLPPRAQAGSGAAAAGQPMTCSTRGAARPSQPGDGRTATSGAASSATAPAVPSARASPHAPVHHPYELVTIVDDILVYRRDAGATLPEGPGVEPAGLPAAHATRAHADAGRRHDVGPSPARTGAVTSEQTVEADKAPAAALSSKEALTFGRPRPR